MNLDTLLAFEDAQGFGAKTKGGRGGQIVKVTNLDDSGTGSLRWALEALTGPRVVVFEVGGRIKLKNQIQVNGQVTVLGQTAPSSITISGGRLRVVESDVIIRGLNIRPGDGPGQDPGNRDGISVGKRGAVVDGVIIDSNSITWAIDENASTWGSPRNITFSNNIIAEALRNSTHPNGAHSMGLLIGDGSSNVTVVGNLLAHNEHRNAQVKDNSTGVEFINNVVYNWGPNGFTGHGASTAHLIGNVYIPGVNSVDREPIRLLSPENGTAYYLKDNEGEVGGALSKISNNHVFTPSNVSVMPLSETLNYVLSHAGNRVPNLDPIDARIIRSVIDRSGKIIDSPSDVGGYNPEPIPDPIPTPDPEPDPEPTPEPTPEPPVTDSIIVELWDATTGTKIATTLAHGNTINLLMSIKTAEPTE